MNFFYLELIPVFLIGLASTGHCALMCGGITAMHSINSRSHFGIVQLGRLVAYMGVGIVFYLAGNILKINNHGDHQVIALLNGALLIILAIILLPIKLPVLLKLNALGLNFWRIIKQKMTPKLRTTHPHISSFTSGVLWGLLPCSMIYSAALLAMVQQSYQFAGLLMLGFWLGTLPGILGAYHSMALIQKIMQKTAVRYAVSAMLVVWAILLVVMFGGFIDSGHQHMHH